jgi:hypothetical protein
MTDEQIISVMYNYASGFSSCIQFRDDAAVIAFARDLLGQAMPDLAPLPEAEVDTGYEDKLNQCVQLIDQFIQQNQKHD